MSVPKTAEAQDKGPAAPSVVAKQPETPAKSGGPQQLPPTATASPALPPNGNPSVMRAAEMLTNQRGNSGTRARMMRTLQRSVGNNRVSSLLGRAIQTKLTVGSVDAPHEREADHVAETITQPGSNPASPVQRQLVMKHPLSRFETVHRESKDDADHEDVDANMEHRITSPSGGKPLPDGVQREMESGLGTDFSRVRVHDSAEDRADAGRLSAKAFTHGEHIWLGAGESANDRKLMAHELTHVVQQGAATETPSVQRQAALGVVGVGAGLGPIAGGMAGLAYAGLVLAGKRSVYELKGSAKFEPSLALRAYLEYEGGSAVINVRYGNLAKGKLYVEERRPGEYIAFPAPLSVEHPEIGNPGGGQTVSLVVSIGSGNEITGSLGVTKPLPPNSIGAAYGSPADQERLLKLLVGGTATHGTLETLKLQNELKNGFLNFWYFFKNQLYEGTSIIAGVSIFDETFTFYGKLFTSGQGLVSADTEIKRDKTGSLFGSLEMHSTWEAKGFTGTLKATYEEGVLEIRGSLTYASPRIQGELNVIATEESRAWKAIEGPLAEAIEGPKPLPGAKATTPGGGGGATSGAPAGGKERLALSGWGVLKFIVTEKINTETAFVVDPDGYITLRGTIRAPHKITLMDVKKTEEKTFFDDKYREMVYVKPAVGIRGQLHVKLTGKAEFGPLTLHDITLTGLYSTNPKIGSQIQISAKLNLSGSATGTLALDGQVALRLGSKYDYLGANPGSVNLTTSAEATVRGVVEAEPTIKRETKAAAAPGKGTGAPAKGADAPDKGADPPDKIPRYTIGGELFIGGEIDLKFSGKVILTAAGIDFWEIDLGSKVFPIAGFGLTSKVAYTLGSEEMPAVEINKGGFEPHRFIRQIIKNDRPKDTEDPAKGGFKEDGKQKGHTIPSDTVPDAPKQEPKTQVVQFTMDGIPHTLFLTLGGPGDPVSLEMATKRGPVRGKISKEQVDLTTARTSPDIDDAQKGKIDRRITDLKQADRDAEKVLQAAAKLGAEPSGSQMDVQGLAPLGDELSQYGDRHDVKDLGEPAPGQPPGPAQPSVGTGTDTEAEDVMSSWPGLKKDQQVIAKVRVILNTGSLLQSQFRQIMDKAKLNGAAGTRMLDYLEQLAGRKISGYKVVLGDLEIGGNKFSGAFFMLEYIDGEGKWGNVTAFESSAEDRRIDATIVNTDYEFKNWGEFRPGTFVEQVAKDYERTGLKGVRWVFKRRELGDKAAIKQQMEDALNDRALASKHGISRRKAQLIIDELDRVLIVY
jgi:hypothetical protein